jgi:hypothetical protein
MLAAQRHVSRRCVFTEHERDAIAADEPSVRGHRRAIDGQLGLVNTAGPVLDAAHGSLRVWLEIVSHAAEAYRIA